MTTTATARPPETGRAYGGGSQVLEINGKNVLVSRLSGGNVVAEAVQESQGNEPFPRKHAGAAHVEPIVADLPAGAVNDVLRDVLRDFLSGVNKSFSGSMLLLDAAMHPVEQRQFDNAMISEARFDALDAGSKEAAKVQITIAPGAVHAVPSSDSPSKTSPDAKAQKRLVAANFRVTIPGVDCTKVARIEPIVITRMASDTAGMNRIATESGGKMSCANLVMIVAESGAKDFVDWHKQAVIDGKRDMEKTATIEWMSPDMKDPMLMLQASGVGVLAVRPVPIEAGSEALRRVAVEMYVERWDLKPAGGSAHSAPANPPGETGTPKVKPPPKKPRG